MFNNPLEDRILAAQSFSDNKQQFKKVKISTQHLPFNKTLGGCCAPLNSCMKRPQVWGQTITLCTINALFISHLVPKSCSHPLIQQFSDLAEFSAH